MWSKQDWQSWCGTLFRVWNVTSVEANVWNVLEANETLWKAEMELNGGIRGGTLVPHRGSEEAFVLFETYLF